MVLGLSKLWPVFQIPPVACIYRAHKLRMVLAFLQMIVKKEQCAAETVGGLQSLKHYLALYKKKKFADPGLHK